MNIDWSTISRVHLIGIGGVGISALARLLIDRGIVISGTEDNESSETLDGLRAQGVSISLDLDPHALPEAQCYIYSDAWLTKHPQVLKEARRRKTLVLSYFEALGSIARLKKVIAIAGAHGKTTTTAMMTDVLEAGGLDPTAIIGSLRDKTESNFRSGKGNYFIVEADEYRRHFLNFSPEILVITNIDADHLDYYHDLGDIQSAFQTLAQKVPAKGFLVCNTGEEAIQPIIKGLSCSIVDYRPFIDPTLSLQVLPLHYPNVAAVLAVATLIGIDPLLARQTLSHFSGTWRRFEYKGKTKKGARVYDDYAHHPTEIAITLTSVRKQFPEGNLLVVFQPHLYSRTRFLMEEFAGAFSVADDILIAPIFAAREASEPAVSSHVLAEKIRTRGKQVQALDSFSEIEEYLLAHARGGDTIVVMGAGDIYRVAQHITLKPL